MREVLITLRSRSAEVMDGNGRADARRERAWVLAIADGLRLAPRQNRRGHTRCFEADFTQGPGRRVSEPDKEQTGNCRLRAKPMRPAAFVRDGFVAVDETVKTWPIARGQNDRSEGLGPAIHETHAIGQDFLHGGAHTD